MYQFHLFHCKECNSLVNETDCFYVEHPKTYKQKGMGYYEDEYYEIKTIIGTFYCPYCHNSLTKEIKKNAF